VSYQELCERHGVTGRPVTCSSFEDVRERVLKLYPQAEYKGSVPPNFWMVDGEVVAVVWWSQRGGRPRVALRVP